jgi:hypothetical protein
MIDVNESLGFGWMFPVRVGFAVSTTGVVVARNNL